MAKFKNVKILQKFYAAHPSTNDPFNQNRHLNRRDLFKQNRSASVADWHQLTA
jgi:putative transposase